MTRIAAAVLLLACGAAFGQSVSFSGHMGYRALLVIDGVPRSLSVGDSVAGVRLVSVNASTAVVDDCRHAGEQPGMRDRTDHAHGAGEIALRQPSPPRGENAALAGPLQRLQH